MESNVEQTEPKYNCVQHYLTAIEYFSELAKQRTPDQPLPELSGNLHTALLMAMPKLIMSLDLQKGLEQESKKMLDDIKVLTQCAKKPDSDRPCLSSFDFINQSTLKNILRRMNADVDDDNEYDSGLITVLQIADKLAVGIQTRDVNDFEEIDRLVNYIEDNTAEFDPNGKSHVITWLHGGYHDQNPNYFRHQRGQYIYVGSHTDVFLDWDVIQPLKLLDLLKPFMSDELYEQSKRKMNNVLLKKNPKTKSSDVGGDQTLITKVEFVPHDIDDEHRKKIDTHDVGIKIYTRDPRDHDEMQELSGHINHFAGEFGDDQQFRSILCSNKDDSYLSVYMQKNDRFDWDKMKPDNFLNVLKPFMTDAVYQQSKTNLAQVVEQYQDEYDQRSSFSTRNGP